VRGNWANQLNPTYLVGLGAALDSTNTKPLLIATANPANVAKAQSLMSGISIPAFYQTAAAALPTNSTLTIAQGLTAFPQYSSVSDVWERMSATSLITRCSLRCSSVPPMDSTSTSTTPTPKTSVTTATSAAALQFRPRRCRAAARAGNRTGSSVPGPQPLPRACCTPLACTSFRWQRAHRRRFDAGACARGRMAVFQHLHLHGRLSDVGCVQPLLGIHELPAAGHMHAGCGARRKHARINGSYGTGPNGTTACNLGIGPGCSAIRYVDPAQFQLPAKTGPTVYLIGNAPRTQPINLRNPGTQNLDASLRRSFPLPRDIGPWFSRRTA